MADRSRLLDMLLAARRTEDFVRGMSRETLESDEKTQFAVARALEILGEAASRASDEEAAAAPDLPWSDLRGIRTVLAHEYFRIDLDIVWGVVTDEVPRIIAVLESAIPGDGDEDEEERYHAL